MQLDEMSQVDELYILLQLKNHVFTKNDYQFINTYEKSELVVNQQKTLLQLFHTSLCINEECSEECKNMKKIWLHLSYNNDTNNFNCKNKCCDSECILSCNLLYHYSKCKERYCIVCEPIRPYIISKITLKK